MSRAAEPVYTSAQLGTWDAEVASGDRFEFGANWASFLTRLNDARIETAEESIRQYLDVDDLKGKTFLDIGSGSGLFSLAARRLGARVTSFDFDPQSVACTAELKRRYSEKDSNWTVRQGSVLDRDLMTSLPQYDVVYSWGVLHHTGAMWEALGNAVERVAPGGLLFISIYNDQGRASRIWTRIKRLYLRAPGPLKWAVLLPAFARLWGPTLLRDSLKGKPLATWRAYGSRRGMDAWHDVLDWLGGYPFEVARPEAIFHFCRDRGLALRKLKTCAGGPGCNEFVFVRDAGS
jgi:2-polyprenyl-6-hydroxyphenyl methylase/3-demethylubiquinone-9 3-methyltransferase